ncbi:tRNA (adenosine(37)-N6)-threonylcarbamoyltransferase complex ATPase subunit type 1 TsaE [Microbacterium radiodurans]|uniref:tRNA threonylcarbamoyladenosine biosynthesis protein TsaE n=1 Tax=Microbacterium radiodurans TaxID=661398 RepID=A0A5J5IPD4_9MICO|nr:tRNA (adenosine(37)-N6)-threonylcarbamoyltransferase complex ATPase subunit type 1 TsaE [Microbacterium radiodurans]KAA9084072.1 tRNA (adenosine(37)-N6)-threonylcarbamoyltransferase complex ATPase subunit type 1 TsaE [Microbacterium radiodurans]
MSGLDDDLGEREITSAADMEAWGREIGARLRAGDLVVLTGPLGAGKTTLTRGIGAGLGVRGPIQSPTFVIARTHPSLVDGPPLVHVDAYRLGSPAELGDLDLDLDASVTIVEWGHGMVDGLRESWWEIELERGWSGTGLDNACGTSGPAAADMEEAAPRLVTVTRRP